MSASRAPSIRRPIRAVERFNPSGLSSRVRLAPKDRDASFIEKNAAGVTVNRWSTFGFLASSAASNEPGYLTHKVLRSLGAVAFDTQARI